MNRNTPQLTEVIKLKEANIIAKLFNHIYESGNIPQDWLNSVLIPLPKTNRVKKSGDFRLISLMSHVLKLFLKVTYQRIYKKCKQAISDEQFGLRSGFGTREALTNLIICSLKLDTIYLWIAFTRSDWTKMTLTSARCFIVITHQ